MHTEEQMLKTAIEQWTAKFPNARKPTLEYCRLDYSSQRKATIEIADAEAIFGSVGMRISADETQITYFDLAEVPVRPS